jgi:hypothetical protein
MSRMNLKGLRVSGEYDYKQVVGTVLKTIHTRTIDEEDSVVLHKVRLDNKIAVSWSNNLQDKVLVDSTRIKVLTV